MWSIRTEIMQSKAKSVAAYLKEVPADRRPTLDRLRRACLSTLRGYEEGMDYGMPSYRRGGVVEIAFASQKNYISLYILKTDVMKRNKAALKGLDFGKACIKYSKPEKLDFAVVQQLLADTVASAGAVC
jgi:uncharacterized protein YdhG (YjbR/CyaY superfamily)